MSFAEQLAARAAEKKRATVSAPSIAPSGSGGDSDTTGKVTTSSSSLSSLEKSIIGNSSTGPDEPATPLSYESGSDTDEAGNRSNNKISSSKRGGRSKAGSGVTSPQSTSTISGATAPNETEGKSQQKSKNKLIQKGSSTNSSSASTNSSSVDYKSRAGKYKSENKKLRIESLLLKAKLEKLEIGKGSDSDSDDASESDGSPRKKNSLAKENESLRENVMELQEQNRHLEIKLLEKEESDNLKRASDSDLGKSNEELLEENVRLTQMLKEIGGLKELERLRTVKRSGIEEKDASIQRLQQQLTETKSELAETTELKNAEIDVLRKQLNRAEHKQTLHEGDDEREKIWNKERDGLRDEIRRLNLEVSELKNQCPITPSSKRDEEEDSEQISRYKRNSNGGIANSQLDNADVASLESIIAMMRQTIDQCNKEKDVLEQRLTEEQERSQMELQAFAKTLEGVDDLRKSAETMSREIRRIKVKGYRPSRTELFGTGTSLEGGRNFGELSAAVEASESMEEAIRLIESQNDAMEERRRMGVVASRAQATATASTNPDEFSSWVKQGETGRYRASGTLAPISDDREGGFLSFWNNASGSGDENGEKSKDEKKKKSKRREKKKKNANSGGSVLTSFF